MTRKSRGGFPRRCFVRVAELDVVRLAARCCRGMRHLFIDVRPPHNGLAGGCLGVAELMKVRHEDHVCGSGKALLAASSALATIAADVHPEGHHPRVPR